MECDSWVSLCGRQNGMGCSSVCSGSTARHRGSHGPRTETCHCPEPQYALITGDNTLIGGGVLDSFELPSEPGAN